MKSSSAVYDKPLFLSSRICFHLLVLHSVLHCFSSWGLLQFQGQSFLQGVVYCWWGWLGHRLEICVCLFPIFIQIDGGAWNGGIGDGRNNETDSLLILLASENLLKRHKFSLIFAMTSGSLNHFLSDVTENCFFFPSSSLNWSDFRNSVRVERYGSYILEM